MKFNLSTAALFVSTLTLGVCSLSLMHQNLIHSKVERKLSSLHSSVSEVLKAANASKPTNLEEIATNRRAADIVSYRLRFNPSITVLQPYIAALNTEIRRDLIEDLAYSNLAEAGSNNIELVSIGDNQAVMRERWKLRIEPGSHFDRNPAARLMFVNESFPSPLCDAQNGFEPYVAFLSTNPTLTIKVEPDMITNTPRYRIEAFDASGKQVINNTTDRVLIDAGCIQSSSNDNPPSDGDAEPLAELMVEPQPVQGS